MIKISEIFVSFQGEGLSVGVPAVFVRFAGCRVRCSFCDSKRAWSVKNAKEYNVGELIEEIVSLQRRGNRLVVFTGGEPGEVSSGDWTKILWGLKKRGINRIEIETSGYRIPRAWKDLDKFGMEIRFNVSPKENAIKLIGDKLYSKNMRWFISNGLSCFKFVVGGVPDLFFVQKSIMGWGIPREKILIMSKGIVVKEMRKSFKVFSEFAKNAGYRVSDRMHIVYGIR